MSGKREKQGKAYTYRFVAIINLIRGTLGLHPVAEWFFFFFLQNNHCKYY